MGIFFGLPGTRTTRKWSLLFQCSNVVTYQAIVQLALPKSKGLHKEACTSALSTCLPTGQEIDVGGPHSPSLKDSLYHPLGKLLLNGTDPQNMASLISHVWMLMGVHIFFVYTCKPKHIYLKSIWINRFSFRTINMLSDLSLFVEYPPNSESANFDEKVNC